VHGNHKRNWKHRTVASIATGAVLSLYAATVMACLTMPTDLARPHSVVIAEARRIVWAEVVGVRPVWHIGKTEKPVRYKFRILRVLKGPGGATIEVDGGNEEKTWDTTFGDHSDDQFWKEASGRMGIHGDCSMEPPSFILGKRYLVLLSSSEDTKQFERVDSERDNWLKFAERRVAGAH
jgi:hypothetical protein